MKNRLAAACVAALLLMPSTAAWSEPQSEPGAAFAATASRLLQQERAALGASFAGAWLDGEQVNVGFAGKSALADARRHPRLAALARGARFVERRFSTAALDRAMAGVVARMTRDGTAYTAAVNVRDNVVDVTVAKPVSGLGSDAVRVTVGRVETQQPFGCDVRTACPVLRAGLVAPDPSGCTLGFTVRNAAGREFATSAGHCSGVNATWSHNGTQIGSTVWSQTSGSADGQVISLRRSTLPKMTNMVFRDVDHATRVVAKIGAPDAALVGQVICSESRAGSRCGQVTSHNATATFRRPDNTTYTLTNIGHFSGAACPGDSGGPIVAVDTAYGFVTGGSVDPATGCAFAGTYFTWGRHFETASGYTIVTDDGASRELRAGQTLTSPNGSYRAEMQGDGNFVVYSPTAATWATNTNGYPGSWMVFQEDGNLVVYRPGGIPIWASNTAGRVVERLELSDTGFLALYQPTGSTPIWGNGRDVLYAGQNMYANAELRSPDGRYRATMQGDGNFVVYGPTGPIWASNTTWATGSWAQMQLDGNFVIYRPGPFPICATGTSGANNRMIMRNDGVLALTLPDGSVPWDTARRTC